MAPRITVVRHAEGSHNVLASRGGFNISDPYLTSLGLMQCANLQNANIPDMNPVNTIITSPSKRAIQTALLCTDPSYFRTNGGRLYLTSALREANPTHKCNQSSTVEQLEAEFGTLLSIIGQEEYEECWGSARDATEMRPEELTNRGLRVRVAIQNTCTDNPQHPNMHVVVVTHGEFIPYLTGDYSLPRFWLNADCRTYEFVDPTYTDANATWRETQESQLRRNAGYTDDVTNAHLKKLLDRHRTNDYNASTAENKSTLF
ncbi:histidine phosphatase superfamily [Hypoxylon cercidicola]|nr:histidine phosphatase superfamily [Hypoxylon cercidicola]